MTEQLERLVTADSCIQFQDLLSPGNMVLVDLGQPPGGMTALTQFWANLLVRIGIDTLMERPSPYEGHHCRVVIDEAQIVARVLDDAAERVLTTGRSRGLSLVTLSQGTTLINEASDTLLRVLLTNTPTKIIGRLAAQDAELLAREQAPGLGIDQTVGELRGKFSANVCNLQDRQFYLLAPQQRTRFVSALVDLDAWKQTEEKQAGSIDALKQRLAVPPRTEPRVMLDDVAEKRPRRNSNPKSSPNAKKPTSQPKPRSPWG